MLDEGYTLDGAISISAIDNLLAILAVSPNLADEQWLRYHGKVLT